MNEFVRLLLTVRGRTFELRLEVLVDGLVKMDTRHVHLIYLAAQYCGLEPAPSQAKIWGKKYPEEVESLDNHKHVKEYVSKNHVEHVPR